MGTFDTHSIREDAAARYFLYSDANNQCKHLKCIQISLGFSTIFVLKNSDTERQGDKTMCICNYKQDVRHPLRK